MKFQLGFMKTVLDVKRQFKVLDGQGTASYNSLAAKQGLHSVISMTD